MSGLEPLSTRLLLKSNSRSSSFSKDTTDALAGCYFSILDTRDFSRAVMASRFSWQSFSIPLFGSLGNLTFSGSNLRFQLMFHLLKFTNNSSGRHPSSFWPAALRWWCLLFRRPLSHAEKVRYLFLMVLLRAKRVPFQPGLVVYGLKPPHWCDFVALKRSISKHFVCFHTVGAHKILAIKAVVDLSTLLLVGTTTDLISFATASNSKKTQQTVVQKTAW